MTTQEAVDILGVLVAQSGLNVHAEALAVLRSDAALGARVRRMPAGSALRCYDDAVPWRVTGDSMTRYDTPEAAIDAVMPAAVGAGMEDAR